MKMRSFHIMGFGMFADFHIEQLDKGVNIFHGPNEAGKTTMFEFIYRMLFGFDLGKRKKDFNLYTPLTGSRTGGRLILENAQGRSFTLERFDSGKTGQFSLIHPDGGIGSEQELSGLLGHVTPDVYRDVFAFGLDELKGLHPDIVKRVYGAALGMKNISISDVLKTLETKAQTFYKSTKGETRVREALLKLEDTRKSIRALTDQKTRFDELALALLRIEEEIRGLEDFSREFRARADHLRALKKAWPFWVEVKEAKEDLDHLPVLDQFPENALVRMEKILDRLKDFSSEQESLSKTMSELNSDYEFLMGKMSDYVSDPRSMAPENLAAVLEGKMEQISAAQGLLSRLNEKRLNKDKMEERGRGMKERLAMALAMQSAPAHKSLLPALLAPLALGLFSGIFFFFGGPGALSILGIISAIILGLYHLASIRRGLKKEREEDKKFDSLQKDIESCEEETGHLDREILAISGEISEKAKCLKISAQPSHEEIENARTAMNRVRERLLEFRKEKNRVSIQMNDVQAKIKEQEKELTRLFNACDTTDEESLRVHAAMFEKRKSAESRLKAARKNILVLAGKNEQAFQEELSQVSPEELDQTLARIETQLRTSQDSLNALRQQRGELLEKMRSLEMDMIPALRSEEEQILAELRYLARTWGVYRMAGHLLEKAWEKYERERQPKVLLEAQGFFGKMTGGKYGRISFVREQESFCVFDSSEAKKEPFLLSRGALEQLYLALRFGLIKSYEESGVVLPVMTDDVLVNFDPERGRHAAEGFLALGESHQVLLFTCHPETVEIFKSLKPGIRVYTI